MISVPAQEDSLKSREFKELNSTPCAVLGEIYQLEARPNSAPAILNQVIDINKPQQIESNGIKLYETIVRVVIIDNPLPKASTRNKSFDTPCVKELVTEVLTRPIKMRIL